MRTYLLATPLKLLTRNMVPAEMPEKLQADPLHVASFPSSPANAPVAVGSTKHVVPVVGVNNAGFVAAKLYVAVLVIGGA